ncbi:MAG: putative transport system permease protein [Frankiaceae bacterium]|nr:putative transport system permease protein [Frankiaceae bacterium]
MSALRACLRIARRDARRAPGRSALVLAMIALPVIGMTSADILFRSAQLDPKETVSRDLGTADAVLTSAFDSRQTVVQNVDASSVGTTSDGPSTRPTRPRTAAELAGLVPDVERYIVEHVTLTSAITHTGGQHEFQWHEFPYGDPLATGTYRQLEGHAPQTAGEVAVTEALAKSLGVRVGESFQLTSGTTVRVTAIVLDPHSLRAQTALGIAGSAPPVKPDARDTGLPDRVFLRTRTPVTWPEVLGLNAHGVIAVSRQAVLNPPPNSEVPGYDAAYQRSVRLAIAGVILLIVGLATLEVVLLAGAAFAVGARRQARALALVSVAGGEPRHVRRIVLAAGLLLGTAGAALGAVLGTVAAALARSWFEQKQGKLLGHFDLRPLEILAVLALGAGTGLLAAVVPARGAARSDVVAVLAGRAGTRTTPLRIPALGVVLVGVGIFLAGVGEAAQSALGSAKWILAGTALVQIGALILTPAIVGLSGRLGRRLPLTPRLAVRDAARHRGRTAPAVGAVMAAVAGSTALAVYLVSDAAHTKRFYLPSTRVGTAYVQFAERPDLRALPELRDAVARELPTRSAALVGVVGCNSAFDDRCTDYISVVVPSPTCDAGSSCGSSAIASAPLVGDKDTLRALIGHRDGRLETALAAGKAIVFVPGGTAQGKATIERSDANGEGRQSTVPAVEAPDLPGVQALFPTALAARFGGSTPSGIFIDTTRMPSQGEEDRARAALAGHSAAFLNVERGPQPPHSGILLALLLGTTIVTLGAAGIATGLAAADGRADMATLSAIGAAPRTRRRLAGAQALTVAALGTVLGVAVGFVPAIAYIHRLPGYSIQVPWSTLLTLVVAVPLSAAVLAMGVTRSRLPLVRRAA